MRVLGTDAADVISLPFASGNLSRGDKIIGFDSANNYCDSEERKERRLSAIHRLTREAGAR